MTRKNVYKVIFMTADELFFLFFTHALPLSLTPQRTYGVKRLFQTFSELQHSIGWAGGRTPKYFLQLNRLVYLG